MKRQKQVDFFTSLVQMKYNKQHKEKNHQPQRFQQGKSIRLVTFDFSKNLCAHYFRYEI